MVHYSIQTGQTLNISDRGSRNDTYTQQWNFGLQRQLAGGIVAEAAYSGNKGTRLPVPIEFNQLHPQYQALGAGLNQRVPNPFLGMAPTGTLSATTVALSQLLRPFPQYIGVSTANPARAQNMDSSIYHVFTGRLEKRFSHGVNFVFSYTNAKLIDDASGRIIGENDNAPALQDNYNLRGERSLSEGDISQRVVFHHSADLPLRGRALWSGAPRWAEFLIGPVLHREQRRGQRQAAPKQHRQIRQAHRQRAVPADAILRRQPVHRTPAIHLRQHLPDTAGCAQSRAAGV